MIIADCHGLSFGKGLLQLIGKFFKLHKFFYLLLNNRFINDLGPNSLNFNALSKLMFKNLRGEGRI